MDKNWKTRSSDPPPRAAARHRGAASGVEGPGRAQRQRREHDRPHNDAQRKEQHLPECRFRRRPGALEKKSETRKTKALCPFSRAREVARRNGNATLWVRRMHSNRARHDAVVMAANGEPRAHAADNGAGT